MDDLQRLEHLIRAKNHCVSIITHEEGYALNLVREAAVKTGAELLIWSVIGGVRDGLLSGGSSVPETEHPAAGLYHLAERGLNPGTIAVTLDLASHLKDERVLRLLRDLLNRFLITQALADSPPLSVTMAEAVNALRAWARKRCVPAD